MQKRHGDTSIVARIIACVAFFAVVVENRAQETHEEQSDRSFRALSNVFIGNISVEGIVVDSDGKVLNDVSMKTETTGLPVVGGSFSPIEEDTEEITLPRGKFAVCYSNVHTLELRFEKEGYCRAACKYAFRLDRDSFEDMPPRVIAVSNLQVRMEPLPKYLGWPTEEGRLHWTTNGVMTVVDLARPPGSRFVTVTNTNKITDTMFCLSPITTSQDNSDAYLRTNDSNGFSRVRLDDLSPGQRVLGWSLCDMHLAPEKGYTNTMTLSSCESYYLYLHVSQLYGKAWIWALSRKGSVLECRVTLAVAVNGQRNVATDR